VHKTPHCVVVIDEIEKAHKDIYNILLQVMDDATLTDSTGRKTDFRNVVLIMTTNAGSKFSEKRSVGFGDSEVEREDVKVLKDSFPPEFRNRLDATIMFSKLTKEAILRVVDKNLSELEGQLAERNVTLSVSQAAREYFGEKGYVPAYGAREMSRVIQDAVKSKLADEILFGSLKSGGVATIDLVDGVIKIDSSNASD
jgi:ATP-dependent Clp protease ATP-binding subunit ClpA